MPSHTPGDLGMRLGRRGRSSSGSLSSLSLRVHFFRGIATPSSREYASVEWNLDNDVSRTRLYTVAPVFVRHSRGYKPLNSTAARNRRTARARRCHFRPGGGRKRHKMTSPRRTGSRLRHSIVVGVHLNSKTPSRRIPCSPYAPACFPGAVVVFTDAHARRTSHTTRSKSTQHRPYHLHRNACKRQGGTSVPPLKGLRKRFTSCPSPPTLPVLCSPCYPLEPGAQRRSIQVHEDTWHKKATPLECPWRRCP